MYYNSKAVRDKELPCYHIGGAWLSLVERCVRDAEVAGSNPVASTPWQGHRKHLSFKFPVFFNQTASQSNIDAWLSLVERCVRDAEVAGSNPVAPIKTPQVFRLVGFVF